MQDICDICKFMIKDFYEDELEYDLTNQWDVGSIDLICFAIEEFNYMRRIL